MMSNKGRRELLKEWIDEDENVTDEPLLEIEPFRLRDPLTIERIENIEGRLNGLTEDLKKVVVLTREGLGLSNERTTTIVEGLKSIKTQLDALERAFNKVQRENEAGEVEYIMPRKWMDKEGIKKFTQGFAYKPPVTAECQHEYPRTWMSMSPPFCKKCGKQAEGTIPTCDVKVTS